MIDTSLICIMGHGQTATHETATVSEWLLPLVKLRYPKEVPTGTLLRIRKGRHSARAIIENCKLQRTSRTSYILTVRILRGGQWLSDLVQMSDSYDPGVHLLNNFITDSHVLQLMREMDSKTHSAR
jgi:hypothetical protein